MKIYMTPHAFRHPQWMAQRTDCQLSSMGILRLEKSGFTLIDPDEVDTVNLAVHGFYEREVGRTRTSAVADQIAAVDSRAKVATWAGL